MLVPELLEKSSSKGDMNRNHAYPLYVRDSTCIFFFAVERKLLLQTLRMFFLSEASVRVPSKQLIGEENQSEEVSLT